jgi:hypothetical protein
MAPAHPSRTVESDWPAYDSSFRAKSNANFRIRPVVRSDTQHPTFLLMRIPLFSQTKTDYHRCRLDGPRASR